MWRILIFTSILFTFSTGLLIDLKIFRSQLGNYSISRSTKVYVISSDPPEYLKDLVIQTSLGVETTDGNILSQPQPDGSLSPFTSLFDNNFLLVTYYNVNPPSGYLYISNVSDLNVFPIFNTSLIDFKDGTNVYFRMVTSQPMISIPVAQNVKIGKNVVLQGFVGVPESTGSKFFDSWSFNQSFYDYLELPMEKFYFVSNTGNVQYQIKYGVRLGIWKNSAGLLTSDDYPIQWNGLEGRVSDYHLGNSDQSELIMIPRLTNNLGLLTIYYDHFDPSDFLLVPMAYERINNTGPMNRIFLNSTGPYAIQYVLTDLVSSTTSNSMDTTTSSGKMMGFLEGVVLVLIMKFL